MLELESFTLYLSVYIVYSVGAEVKDKYNVQTDR